MGDELRIITGQPPATPALDRRDISQRVGGYQLSQVAGTAPVLVL